MNKAATIIITGIALKTMVLYSLSVASARAVSEATKAEASVWKSVSNCEILDLLV